MKRCSIPGCEKIHEAKGYCKVHYRSFFKYGDPLHVEKVKAQREKAREERETKKAAQPKRMSRKGTCSYQGCDKPIQCRKLCATHYSRWLRNGHCELIYKKNELKDLDECLAINCTKKPKRHGLCDKHLINVKELKTPYRAKIVKLCGVEGCENLHMGNGLCKKHYPQWKIIIRDSGLSNHVQMKGYE